jgi:hypothetical protein
MSKWVGSFKLLLSLALILFHSLEAHSSEDLYSAKHNLKNWPSYKSFMESKIKQDQTVGNSYIISGSLGLLGGIVGASITNDPLEKAVYSVFQTIGIASIGYGSYRVSIGDQDRFVFEVLNSNAQLTPSEKMSLLKSYYEIQHEQQLRNNRIRAITHGLIGGLNLYNASQLDKGGAQNTLVFIAVANLLASLSFTF